MECKKCGKEITLDDEVVYCAYCGAKLKGEEARKSILTRKLKVPGIGKAFIVWMLLCVIIWVFLAFFGELFSITLFGSVIPWLISWIVLSLIGATYFTLAYVVYNHAKRHNRRAVAWATAFIVFTPILAGVAYLLSWPKE